MNTRALFGHRILRIAKLVMIGGVIAAVSTINTNAASASEPSAAGSPAAVVGTPSALAPYLASVEAARGDSSAPAHVTEVESTNQATFVDSSGSFHLSLDNLSTNPGYAELSYLNNANMVLTQWVVDVNAHAVVSGPTTLETPTVIKQLTPVSPSASANSAHPDQIDICTLSVYPVDVFPLFGAEVMEGYDVTTCDFPSLIIQSVQMQQDIFGNWENFGTQGFDTTNSAVELATETTWTCSGSSQNSYFRDYGANLVEYEGEYAAQDGYSAITAWSCNEF
jgi:hypothetical protein